jgi:hypothetical protein
MTDLFSMGYPHWLIVAGAVLVVLGCIGLALVGGRTGVEVTLPAAEIKPADIANNNEQGPPEFLTAQTDANRKAKLAEQTRDRWAKTR